MIRYLSHFLKSSIPVYGCSRTEIGTEKRKSIKDGDSCNTYWIGLENHWGTHVDAPAHFFDDAFSVADYPAEYWIFKHPQVIEIPCSEGILVSIEHLEDKLDAKTDLLLIKTGFQRFRGEEKYSTGNPGVDSRVGPWLRARYKTIKAIGFDFVSISSYQNREEGRLAHKAFLDPNAAGSPILIIEDMHVGADLSKLEEVWVVPLMLQGIDSAPCTVMGVFE